MDDRAGKGSGDSFDTLDFGNNQLAQGVNILAGCLDDDVVGSGHIVRGVDAVDFADLICDYRRFSDFRLDQDIRLHQVFLHSLWEGDSSQR